MSDKEISFEECLPLIDEELEKRRHKWQLTSIAWMDYEDVKQIIRIHIYNKFSQYNSDKPLKPWVNRIISNQIKNLIRNNYNNFAKPCQKCKKVHNLSESCDYNENCSKCQDKKNAYNIKLPVSIDNHPQENYDSLHEHFDLTEAIKKMHDKMLNYLTPIEAKVYNYLYIHNMEEYDVAVKMNYINSKNNEIKGQRYISNIKKNIIEKAKELVKNDEIDLS